jgi:hypothetical protein
MAVLYRPPFLYGTRLVFMVWMICPTLDGALVIREFIHDLFWIPGVKKHDIRIAQPDEETHSNRILL